MMLCHPQCTDQNPYGGKKKIKIEVISFMRIGCHKEMTRRVIGRKKKQSYRHSSINEDLVIDLH